MHLQSLTFTENILGSDDFTLAKTFIEILVSLLHTNEQNRVLSMISGAIMCFQILCTSYLNNEFASCSIVLVLTFVSKV